MATDPATFPQFTVIETTDWAMLFADERLMSQGHSIPIDGLAAATNGQPFTLVRLTAYDTVLEVHITEHGSVSATMTLTDANNLMDRKKFPT